MNPQATMNTKVTVTQTHSPGQRASTSNRSPGSPEPTLTWCADW